jgi:hypothetical protein
MMGRQIVIGAALLIALVLRSHVSFAFGAVAEGLIRIPDRGTGWSIGFSINQPDEQTAKDNAVKNCKKYGGPDSQKLCQPVMTFQNKCVSAAEDPKAGTPGIGWAVGDTTEEATAAALSRCRSTAGADRQSFCETFSWKADCDGTAK